MTISRIPRLLATALTAAIAWPANAALEGRDLDGDASTAEAYFDTELGISWVADWNLAQTLGADDDGLMDWYAATDWVANLTYRGIKGWRLPKTGPVDGTSFQIGVTNNGTSDRGFAATGAGWGAASEIGHLFYVTLGLKGRCAPDNSAPTSCTPQPGWTPTPSSAPSVASRFTNMQSGYYWSSTEFLGLGTDSAWGLHTGFGYQNIGPKTLEVYAVPVWDGDVASAVPEPATWGLMLFGVGVLVLSKRSTRQRHDQPSYGR